MGRTIGIGHQNFEDIRIKNNFYVDKTHFIKEWWEADDAVTLIARPRRFGKTLNISMMEKFFSIEYAKQGELFEGLSIWKEEKYRQLQGSYPVICVSFANVKEISFQEARKKICYIIETLYNRFEFLLDGELLNEKEKRFYHKVSADMEDYVATSALGTLCEFLCRYYRKKVIILLDEYDTPLQEAFVNGYWHEISTFIRSLFNSAFKTNPYLERAIMTGITRVSKESIFSALNNLEVKVMFERMIRKWFGKVESDYNDFIRALCLNDVEAMNEYMNRVAFSVFSYFDTGKEPSKSEPERFYHGFVLGLMVELADRYILTSNRESGFGRYDVMLEPRRPEDDGMILEFKVFQPRKEKDLQQTAEAALQQIEQRQYAALLMEKGVPKEKIKKYGFAFCGNKVQIVSAIE